MIKAIETVYKGYRFRSRLEARWAVFFDTLGISWKYESEGYELSNGARYLPDFKLGDGTYVEVKGEPIYRKHHKIYLAGKMGDRRDDWRSVDNSFADETGYTENLSKPKKLGVYGHIYTGPFAIDESGGHDGGHITVCGHDSEAPEELKKLVLTGALKQISEYDLLFAWLDSKERYGTIAEIGYAKGLGKEIWIGVKGGDFALYELWFVKGMADKLVYASLPQDAFEQMEGLHPDEQKCQQFSKDLGRNGRVIMLSGDPGDNSHYATEFYNGESRVIGGHLYLSKDRLGVLHQGYWCPGTSEKVIAAHNAAKQARFEFGESG